MTLINKLDLQKAYKRVQQDKRDDSWPDIINYRDYEHNLKNNLQALENSLQDSSYQPKQLRPINVPKKGFTLRPGDVPEINDRIIYQALADFLSPYFTPEKCVYSNKLSKNINSTRMFIPGVELWLGFQKDVKKFSNEHPYLVETDITAYFDHIEHKRMFRKLDDVFSNQIEKSDLTEAKKLLKNLWGKWSKNTGYGIPQINDASSFFANIFMDDIDKRMIRRGYVYMRYVDDMRVFTDSEPNARKILSELIVELRNSGLYVASAKTKIKQTNTVLAEIKNDETQINAIEAELKAKKFHNLQNAATMLNNFFEEIISDTENFNGRHFRYCVNRFKKLKVNNLALEIHKNVVNEVLNRLISMPDTTTVFVDYLSLFPESATVQNRVIDFLESDYNVYPWQEMLLFELLIRSKIVQGLHDRAMNVARIIARNEQNHTGCREKAFVLWGQNGDYSDRREIKDWYYKPTSNISVKRAILCAIQEMQPAERNYFLNNAAQDALEIEIASEYIRQLSNPKYHYYNPPRGFDIVEDWDSTDIDDLPMPSP